MRPETVLAKYGTPEKRLMSRVEYDTNGGCWLWAGAMDLAQGYGTLEVDGHQIGAHRLSWRLFRGEPGTLFVLHKCDIPSCVNPDHLFLGTNAANVADMVSKGRQPKGSSKTQAKLSEDDVKEMRRRRAEGCEQSELVIRFGISQSNVSRITNGKMWRHSYAK